MSDIPFPFGTTADVLSELAIAKALAESEAAECQDYGRVFFARSRSADEARRPEEAKAWHLLGQLTQVGLEAANTAEPFRPLLVTSDGRSILLSDMDQATAEGVWTLAQAVVDPELRARLSDVTWDRLRNPDAARLAIRSYLETAERLFDPEHWPPYAERMERALRLAAQIRDSTLLTTVLAEMERRVLELNGNDPLYLTSELMELLHEFRFGDPDAMSTLARKAAEAAEGQRDYWRSRSHYENAARWRRSAKDHGGEREARVAIARTFERQAELHSGEGGELQAAHFLEAAHEAYRNIPSMREKTAEVYERLREAQQLAVQAMHEIRTDGIDISDWIRRAREHVSGRPMRDAFVALAGVASPTNFEQAAGHSKELMRRFPLQNLVGGQRVERDGRVIAHRTPGLLGDEAQAEAAVWERVVEQTAFSHGFTVQALIIPAVNQIDFEHRFSLHDLRDLVLHNPLVPEGHEVLFARGLLAGLRGDYEDALSILVPQLENSLRLLLARSGVETTRRDKHGIQTVIQMGTILSDHRSVLEPMLSPDVFLELKVLFGDPHGPNLRNRIAHGQMAHDDFYSGPAIYAWWFIYHLCMRPVRARFRKPAEEPASDAGTSIE
ncbi:DUF4209 domain-containing protein [Thalassobaculum sp.]|uniref:DUF4209 domain-containing protein n=1 Tax=Thalassobaculum sp. TaxID=2022740 RepID=UPI0032EDA237